ncbi:GntR family transcriptional regulator, partial [Methylobacterium soli]
MTSRVRPRPCPRPCPRPRAELPLQLGLDPAGAQPLHAQVREALRSAILVGRLAPGARLPASRVLAADLGCARGTVLLA